MIYNLRSASVQRRQSEIKSVFRGGRERQGRKLIVLVFYVAKNVGVSVKGGGGINVYVNQSPPSEAGNIGILNYQL